MRQLTVAEADFVDVARHAFSFLSTEFGSTSDVETDNEGVTLRFHNAFVELAVRLEGDRQVFLELVPLRGGEASRLFDAHGAEPLTRYPLVDVIRFYSPKWQPPSGGDDAVDRSRMTDIVGPYAEAFKRTAAAVLRGDHQPFPAIEAEIKRTLVPVLMRDWSHFVQRVRSGFSGGPGEYTLGITSRGQLEDVLRNWKGNVSPSVRGELAELDDAFDDATVPLDRSKRLPLVPAEHARRWWRRPRLLAGPLKDFFSG